jgi:hypothetical protein
MNHHSGLDGVFVDQYQVYVAYILDDNFNDITSQVQLIPDIPLGGSQYLTAQTSAGCIITPPGDGGCSTCGGLNVKIPKKQ